MNHRAQGFTLLELLLVVFILSALAFTATAFVANQDDQFRFEDTRARLAQIRRAVAGESAPVHGGQVIVSGYVADNGVLPGDTAALIGTQPAGYAASGLQDPVFDSDPDPVSGHNDGTNEMALSGAAEKLEKGWRSGYLHAPPGANGAFRDGWGNPGGIPNYGWQLASASGALTVASLGKDNAAGGSGYDADMADTVAQADWAPNVAGLTVRIKNQSSIDFSGRLRASLLTFVNTAGGAKWKRYTTDDLTCLDGTGDGSVAGTPCAAEATLTFSAGGFPGGAYADTRVPIGRHLLLLVVDTDTLAHNGSTESPYPSAAAPVSRQVVCYPAGCPVETLVIR